MEKKGIELAISTLILIILGVCVLIGLIYVVTGGFSKLKTSTTPLLETTEGSAVKNACEIACQSNNRLNFCCGNYTIKSEKNIKCTDSRLEIKCSEITCEDFNCVQQTQRPGAPPQHP
jgi:hypothetical protein